MKRNGLSSSLLVSAFIVAGCGRESGPTPEAAPPPSTDVASAFTPDAERAAETITGDYLRSVVAEISDDRYEGRSPGTKGDESVRRWLSAELARIGLQPGGTEGWEQPFDLVGLTANMPAQWTFEKDGKRLALAWREQYMGGSGVQQPSVAFSDAEVVFVGYGIEAPEYGWDDFKGADLKGKVLLVLNSDPDWDPALFAGKTRLYYGRWGYKYESAARQGAVAAIIIHTTPSAGYPWQVVQTSWSGEEFQVPAGGEPRVLVQAWATEDAARKLVALAGRDLDGLVQSARNRDFHPVPLGVRTSLDFEVALQRTRSANVVGVLPGADAALGSEAVIYSAHHDHLGIGEPDATGDRIYNGASDNAAGVAQVLAIAQALKALPQAPRRSIVVALVGAEEQGLLGSQFYAQNPTFPPGRIAANINYDGGNIFGRARDLVYIGKGKSTLDAVIDAVAARQDRVVVGDQFPDRGYFYRSDQFNFAKIGVPALYLYKSTDIVGREPGWGRAQLERYEAKDYHQPSDELRPDWSFDGMVENARAGFWAGLIIANQQAMPQWKPGDEFEAARKAALAAVDR